jgi:hypothetical protein
VDKPTLISGRIPFRRPVAGVAALGLLALAGAALAAPCADLDGCTASRSLTSLNTPFGALKVRSVDLAATDPAAADVTVTDSAAPLLYLTPRVASILEDVFGEEEADAAVEPLETEPAPAAPLAAGAASEEKPERYGTLSQAESGEQLPKFQRQMYRTDI